MKRFVNSVGNEVIDMKDRSVESIRQLYSDQTYEEVAVLVVSDEEKKQLALEAELKEIERIENINKRKNEILAELSKYESR